MEKTFEIVRPQWANPPPALIRQGVLQVWEAQADSANRAERNAAALRRLRTLKAAIVAKAMQS